MLCWIYSKWLVHRKTERILIFVVDTFSLKFSIMSNVAVNHFLGE